MALVVPAPAAGASLHGTMTVVINRNPIAFCKKGIMWLAYTAQRDPNNATLCSHNIRSCRNKHYNPIDFNDMKLCGAAIAGIPCSFGARCNMLHPDNYPQILRVPAPVPAPVAAPVPVPAPAPVAAPVAAPVPVPAPVPALVPVPAPVAARADINDIYESDSDDSDSDDDNNWVQVPQRARVPVPAPVPAPVPVPVPAPVPAPAPASPSPSTTWSTIMFELPHQGTTKQFTFCKKSIMWAVHTAKGEASMAATCTHPPSECKLKHFSPYIFEGKKLCGFSIGGIPCSHGMNCRFLHPVNYPPVIRGAHPIIAKQPQALPTPADFAHTLPFTPRIPTPSPTLLFSPEEIRSFKLMKFIMTVKKIYMKAIVKKFMASCISKFLITRTETFAQIANAPTADEALNYFKEYSTSSNKYFLVIPMDNKKMSFSRALPLRPIFYMDEDKFFRYHPSTGQKTEITSNNITSHDYKKVIDSFDHNCFKEYFTNGSYKWMPYFCYRNDLIIRQAWSHFITSTSTNWPKFLSDVKTANTFWNEHDVVQESYRNFEKYNDASGKAWDGDAGDIEKLDTCTIHRVIPTTLKEMYGNFWNYFLDKPIIVAEPPKNNPSLFKKEKYTDEDGFITERKVYPDNTNTNQSKTIINLPSLAHVPIKYLNMIKQPKISWSIDHLVQNGEFPDQHLPIVAVDNTTTLVINSSIADELLFKIIAGIRSKNFNSDLMALIESLPTTTDDAELMKNYMCITYSQKVTENKILRRNRFENAFPDSARILIHPLMDQLTSYDAVDVKDKIREIIKSIPQRKHDKLHSLFDEFLRSLLIDTMENIDILKKTLSSDIIIPSPLMDYVRAEMATRSPSPTRSPVPPSPPSAPLRAPVPIRGSVPTHDSLDDMFENNDEAFLAFKKQTPLQKASRFSKELIGQVNFYFHRLTISKLDINDCEKKEVTWVIGPFASKSDAQPVRTILSQGKNIALVPFVSDSGEKIYELHYVDAYTKLAKKNRTSENEEGNMRTMVGHYEKVLNIMDLSTHNVFAPELNPALIAKRRQDAARAARAGHDDSDSDDSDDTDSDDDDDVVIARTITKKSPRKNN